MGWNVCTERCLLLFDFCVCFYSTQIDFLGDCRGKEEKPWKGRFRKQREQRETRGQRSESWTGKFQQTGKRRQPWTRVYV